MQSNREGIPASLRFAKGTRQISRPECRTVAPKRFQYLEEERRVESKGRIAGELAGQKGALTARKPSADAGTWAQDGVQGTCATCHAPLCPLALCIPSSLCQGTLITLCGNTPRRQIWGIYSMCNQQSASFSCFHLKTKQRLLITGTKSLGEMDVGPQGTGADKARPRSEAPQETRSCRPGEGAPTGRPGSLACSPTVTSN